MSLVTVKESLSQNLATLESAVAPEVIAELKSFTALTIAGIDDKAGYKAVDEARKVAKKQRIAVDKMRKEMGEEALRYKQAVDDTARRIQSEIISPAEEHCKAEIERIDAERARIEKEKKITAEIESLWDEAHESNRQFDAVKAEALRLEKQRLEQEEKERQLAEKQAEIDRKEREARIAAEAEEKARRAAQERIEKAEREAAEAKMRAEQAERAAAEKSEREAREKAEAEQRRLALAPDIEKARTYLLKIQEIEIPKFNDRDMENMIDKIVDSVAIALENLATKEAV